MKKKKSYIMKKLSLFLIFLMILIWGINVYFYLQLHKPATIYILVPSETTTTTTIEENVTIIILKKCNLNSDCSWQSTNCCPENTGAYWQCINVNESVIRCVGNIFCLDFISPKPTASCSCQQGECVG